jgi:lipopolysaccharide export system protein LptC
MTAGRLTTAAAPLLLIGVLAAVTFWLDRLVNTSGNGPWNVTRHDPDYTVDKLSGARLGGNGTVTYTLSAEKMMHYPDDDSTLLTAPRFVSYGGSAKVAVTVTASEAVVSSNGEHVYFQDDVRVARAAHAGGSELVMRTTFLHVVPDRHIARTDRTVFISDATATVSAVGLEMNSETRVIKLLSNVRGIYDPARAPRSGH